MKRSRRYKENSKKIDKQKTYELEEGVQLIQGLTRAKFDESVEIAMRLGVDPKKADQMIRGTIVLPNGTGKDVKVLVLCTPPKDEEAREAGADLVGLEEYVEKIENGWSDVDAVIATPDVMKHVGKLGRYLGPQIGRAHV